MKIKGVIFDVGQTLSNQLDKERLVERNKKYYAYVYEEMVKRGFSTTFPALSSHTNEEFVEDLNILNLHTRAEKNISTEVLKEYRMSEQTLDILIRYEEDAETGVTKEKVYDEAIPKLDSIYAGTNALDEGVYELWPDTKETLEELRRKGYILGLASNTAHPVKHEHMLARLGITPLIDHFAVSSYIGVRKPNPEMVRILLTKMGLVADEVIVVGDLLDRDILMGNSAGVRTVWINAIPYSLQQNLKRITEGDIKYMPTAGIVCLAQLIPTIQYLDEGGHKDQIRVGYYFPHLRKKLETGKQGAFVSGPKVTYLPVELRAPIENLGKFNVIVHKVTDLLLSNNPEDQEAIRGLQDYLSRNPDVLLLDPLDGLQYSNNRRAFADKWTEFSYEGIRVRVPDLYTQENAKFPCIVKTETACQVKKSHDMIIVHNSDSLQEALQNFNTQCIIQEWIPHSAIFKVYILGNFFQASPQKIVDAGNSTFAFNSAKMPIDLPVNHSDNLNTCVIQELNKRLKNITGLGMISYDLGVQSESGDYVVIDFNYFPGYYTVENYKDVMDEYILEKYREFKEKSLR